MLQKIFLLWTFILFGRPQDFLTFLVPLRLVLLCTFFVAVGTVSTGKIANFRNIKKNAILKKYFLLYVLMIVTIPFSVHKGRSFSFAFFEFLVKVLYFYFFVILISSKKDLEKVVFVACISNFFYAALCLINSGSFAGRFRFGAMYDPNDLAYFLISLFPLSLYFLSGKHSKVKKIIAGTTIVLSILTAVLTGSRGGFLGLLVVGILFLFIKIRPFKLSHKIAMIVLLLIVVGLNINKVDTERFSSTFNPGEDYNLTDEEGRIAVWTRGLQLTMMHPITGVGVDCFPVAIGNLREKLGIPPRWQAPHNSFIQILTELGIPGFILFITMIVGAVRTLYRCARKNASSLKNDQELMLMNKIVLLAFTGNLVTSFFLSMAYSPLLTLFIALSVVLKTISEKATSPQIET